MGLQHALDAIFEYCINWALQVNISKSAVFEYCINWALQVNISKSKVIIFQKEKLKITRPFNLGEIQLTLTIMCIWVQPLITIVLNKIARAKRTTYGIVNKIMKFDLPVDISLDFYDKLIIPIMLYGCNIWRFKNAQQVNVTCNYLLKKILKLNKSTSTCTGKQISQILQS